MQQPIMPFLMLAGGLLAFLLSTKQFPLVWRALVWLVGVGLIGGAIFFAATMKEHYGILRVAQDAWAHLNDFGDSVLAQAVARNVSSVDRYFVPLLDLFLVIALALGALALLAFTPGDALEKSVRPLTLLLLGSMLGGIAALAVVAVGFGGYVKPRSYVAQVGAEDVYDGDTFWIGDVSVRLWGLDAPDLGQTCRRGVIACGAESRRQLATFVAGKIVQCRIPPSSDSGHPPMESFGRPILVCDVVDGGSRISLAEWMIANGFGVEYRGEHRFDFGYSDEETSAGTGAPKGLHDWCTIDPRSWRRSKTARDAFLNDQPLPPDVDRIGCRV